MNRIGVNQGVQGGANYPFVSSTDLSLGVLDAYLSYETSELHPELPFELEIEGDGSGFTAVIRNALDEDLVTVDSVDATITVWGNRTVYEWREEEAILRLVVKNSELQSGSGNLDARVVNLMPRRVRSITVNDVELTGDIVFRSGYNTTLSSKLSAFKEGARNQAEIAISAVPGAGLGKYPGCEDVEPVLRTINRRGPDKAGNFIIETSDCLRVEQPLLVEGSGVKTATFEHPELTDEEAASAVVFYDDCYPCCDCAEYVRVYRGLKRIWEEWETIATEAEAVRDTLIANKERWENYAACVEANPSKLTVLPENGGRNFIGFSFCNTTSCCLTDVELRVTMQRYTAGVLQGTPPAGVSITESLVTGSGFDGEVRYYPQFYSDADNWPIMVYRFDYVNPQETVSVRCKLCVNTGTDDAVKTTLTCHVPDGECTLPTPAVPSDIQTLWTTYGVPEKTTRSLETKTTPINNTPLSYPCDC